MRVEFELGQADFAAFTDAVWRNRVGAAFKPRRWLLVGVLLAIAVALGVVLTLLTGTDWLADPFVKFLLWAIAVVFALLIAVTLVLAALRRYSLGRPPRDPAMLGWRVIELVDDGVRETTASGSELTPWKAVQEVSETPELILFYLSRVSAHVVPKRAFSSVEELGRFVERARSRAGRDPEPPPSSALGWSKPVS